MSSNENNDQVDDQTIYYKIIQILQYNNKKNSIKKQRAAEVSSGFQFQLIWPYKTICWEPEQACFKVKYWCDSKRKTQKKKRHDGT